MKLAIRPGLGCAGLGLAVGSLGPDGRPRLLARPAAQLVGDRSVMTEQDRPRRRQKGGPIVAAEQGTVED